MTPIPPTLFDIEDVLLPVQPYGGSSGHSGSDTSRDRADNADKSGQTRRNQTITINHLTGANYHGLTWRDLADRTGWHHGSASGALSVLHKAGIICRLTETRNRCAIYVMPDYVNGRQTASHRPNVSARILVSILEEIDHDLSTGNVSLAMMRIRQTIKTMGIEEDNR